LSDLKERLRTADSVSEKRRLRVALQKHFTVIVLPLIIVLFSAPFAVTFGRRGGNGKVNLSLVNVFGIWLGFMALSAFFEQLGYSGFLADYIAVWAPILILTSVGAYFLAKTPN
jgi:lipopolysaccharide export LptBFGC system permease protein LptF